MGEDNSACLTISSALFSNYLWNYQWVRDIHSLYVHSQVQMYLYSLKFAVIPVIIITIMIMIMIMIITGINLLLFDLQPTTCKLHPLQKSSGWELKFSILCIYVFILFWTSNQTQNSSKCAQCFFVKRF